MPGEHEVKRFKREPTCKEVFGNEKKPLPDNIDGYLTVKIIQCGNSQNMPSLNLSQTNRFNLCDTFQIKSAAKRSARKKSMDGCKRCRGYARRSKNCPCK